MYFQPNLQFHTLSPKHHRTHTHEHMSMCTHTRMHAHGHMVMHRVCLCMVLLQHLDGPLHSLTHLFLSFMQSISVFGVVPQCQAPCQDLLGRVSPYPFSKCSQSGRERGPKTIIPSLVPLLLSFGYLTSPPCAQPGPWEPL